MSLFHTSTCFEHTCSSLGVLSQPVHGTATYRCDDTRCCIVQFWPPDDEHMCSKHVEGWNKLIIKFSAWSCEPPGPENLPKWGVRVSRWKPGVAHRYFTVNFWVIGLQKQVALAGSIRQVGTRIYDNRSIQKQEQIYIEMHIKKQ